jgi:outer membrane immunogenic protein
MNQSARTAITNAGTFSLTDESFIGGPQVGFNFQRDGIVLGFQADVAFGIEQERSRGPYVEAQSGIKVLEIDKVKYDWLATFRPRVGVTNGPWLFYLTAGVAAADIEVSKNFSWSFNDGCPQRKGLDNCHVGGRSETDATGVVGGGLEWAPHGGRLSLQLEYLFITGFDDVDFTTVNRSPSFKRDDIFQPADHTVDTDNIQLIRVGLNWRFGAGHHAAVVEEPALK